MSKGRSVAAAACTAGAEASRQLRDTPTVLTRAAELKAAANGKGATIILRCLSANTKSSPRCAKPCVSSTRTCTTGRRPSRRAGVCCTRAKAFQSRSGICSARFVPWSVEAKCSAQRWRPSSVVRRTGSVSRPLFKEGKERARSRLNSDQGNWLPRRQQVVTCQAGGAFFCSPGLAFGAGAHSEAGLQRESQLECAVGFQGCMLIA